MSLKDEIIKESKTFVRQNRGLKLDRDQKSAFNYLSPRPTSEFMDCAQPFTFDQYSHCSFGCSYCFSFLSKQNNPTFNKMLHAINPKKFAKAMEGKGGPREKALYDCFFKQRFIMHWGGMADPFCNFELANGVGYEVIEMLSEEAYPTIFCTKGSAAYTGKYEKLFVKNAHNKNFIFQVSIPIPDDKLARQIEIGVQSPTKRLRMLKHFSDMGYYTVLRLRPFIIGITDVGLDELLEKALKAGIKAISTEFFIMDSRAGDAMQKRFEWIGQLTGIENIRQYYRILSPKERGGYLRLNRLVKERYIKKIFLFCQKHKLIFGCGDPDFKELNTSGTCCGPPAVYPANPELTNWSKAQVAWFLRDARIKYNRNGYISHFQFNKIYDTEASPFLIEKRFGTDHVGVVSKPLNERHDVTYLDFARNVWNNLNSPGNPRNYFHGKLMPVNIDKDDNYVFKYVPSEYETQWAKEGIDLTEKDFDDGTKKKHKKAGKDN